MRLGDSIPSDSGNWAPSGRAAPAGRCCLSLQKGFVLIRQWRDEPSAPRTRMSNGQSPSLVFGVGWGRQVRRMLDKGEWETLALGKLRSE